MRKSAGIGLVMLLLVGAFGAVANAQQPLSATDYAEIQQLYYLYADAWDRNDPVAAEAVWTADAEFHSGPRILRGPKEIATLAARGQVRALPKIVHMTSNILIKPSPEGARGQAYVVTMDLEKYPAVTGGAVYEDTFVKTKDGWRIKKRVMHYGRAAAPGPPTATSQK